jgi:hypothetical protein
MGCGCGCGTGKSSFVPLVVAGAVLIGTAWFVAQRSEDRAVGLTPTAQPEQPEDPMAAMERLGRPGEGHKQLERCVGTWNATTRFQMGPDQPWEEGSGTETNEWVLGGRWVRTHFKSTFGGEPYEGMGYMGFDNARQKYVMIWVDNMSTSAMMHDGTYDHATSSITYEGKSMMGSMEFTSRHIQRFVNDNEHTLEFFHDYGDGNGFVKVGEVTYTRAR